MKYSHQYSFKMVYHTWTSSLYFWIYKKCRFALGVKKKEIPVIIIYSNLDTISDCFLYVTQQMERDQYHPSSVEPVVKNRLFNQYHAQYPKHERKRIVDKLISGKSTHCVFFVTVAFRIGIDCNNCRIIHIDVLYAMEEYCKELGWPGRNDLPARGNSYYNSYNISNMSEVMTTYVQSKKCKRKLILNYFDHEVPKDQPHIL